MKTSLLFCCFISRFSLRVLLFSQQIREKVDERERCTGEIRSLCSRYGSCLKTGRGKRQAAYLGGRYYNPTCECGGSGPSFRYFIIAYTLIFVMVTVDAESDQYRARTESIIFIRRLDRMRARLRREYDLARHCWFRLHDLCTTLARPEDRRSCPPPVRP